MALAACQAASRVLEHGRSSDAPLTTRMLGCLTVFLVQLALRCGSCHEFLPAAPRALEAVAAAMQQMQVGRAGCVGGLLGWGGQFAQWGVAAR